MSHSYLSIISVSIYLLSLSFLSCTPAKNSTQQEVVTEAWQGRWEWEETRYVRRGGESVTNPKEMGVTMEIELLANGDLKVYHDKSLQKTYTYQVSKQEEELMLTVNYDKTELKPTVESGILRCTGNVLEIIGGYNDAGGNQKYRRMK